MKIKAIKNTKEIIGIPISTLTIDEQISLIFKWIHKNENRVILLANIFKIVKANQNKNYSIILKSSDLIISASASLVWMLKKIGHRNQQWVSYIHLFKLLCKRAQEDNIKLFLIGDDICLLKKMNLHLRNEFPSLTIGGIISLEDRTLPEENRKVIDEINNSNSSLVLVSLSSPNEEKRLVENRNQINSTMIGLGSAFRVYAKQNLRQLITGNNISHYKPRRRLLHYFTIIPRFIPLAVGQIISEFYINYKESNGFSDRDKRQWIILREEWLFDLREIEVKLAERGLPRYYIEFIILICVLDMFVADFKIKTEESWLPSKLVKRK